MSQDALATGVEACDKLMLDMERSKKFPRRIIAVSGPVGSGKTRSLVELLRVLAARGLTVRGVLEADTGRDAQGSALGFSMLFLWAEGGELKTRKQKLALRGDIPSRQCREPFAHGAYVFDAAAFKRADDFIACALGGGQVDLIALDEIGRLELSLGAGHASCLARCLERLSSGPAEPGLLVCAVRQDCVQGFRGLAERAGLGMTLIDPPAYDKLLSACEAALRT